MAPALGEPLIGFLHMLSKAAAALSRRWSLSPQPPPLVAVSIGPHYPQRHGRGKQPATPSGVGS
ncbi:MAG: hypothetical protein ACK6AD_03760 [Cyanobacteriota bacterium]